MGTRITCSGRVRDATEHGLLERWMRGRRDCQLSKLRTPSKAEWERHVVSHMPFRYWCRHCVAGRLLERRHQKHPGHDDQPPLVCIRCGYLRRRCHTDDGEQWTCMQSRSLQTGWTRLLDTGDLATDGEPVVMQVAAPVRDARRAGSVTTLETSAPGDHAGNGLAWSGRSRVNLS